MIARLFDHALPLLLDLGHLLAEKAAGLGVSIGAKYVELMLTGGGWR